MTKKETRKLIKRLLDEFSRYEKVKTSKFKLKIKTTTDEFEYITPTIINNGKNKSILAYSSLLSVLSKNNEGKLIFPKEAIENFEIIECIDGEAYVNYWGDLNYEKDLALLTENTDFKSFEELYDWETAINTRFDRIIIPVFILFVTILMAVTYGL